MTSGDDESRQNLLLHFTCNSSCMLGTIAWLLMQLGLCWLCQHLMHAILCPVEARFPGLYRKVSKPHQITYWLNLLLRAKERHEFLQVIGEDRFRIISIGAGAVMFVDGMLQGITISQ